MSGEKYAPRRTPVHNALQAFSVTEAIQTRRSIRQFTDEIVSMETIRKLLELSARAPSGGNVQPWKVYVLGPSKRDELVRTVAQRIAQKEFEGEACE